LKESNETHVTEHHPKFNNPRDRLS